MDLESISRWEDYSRAKDEMFVHTDIPEAPWWVVEADDKRAARLNMIAHLLSIGAVRARAHRPLGSAPAARGGLRAAAARALPSGARPRAPRSGLSAPDPGPVGCPPDG